jgi:hypothetical protein
MNCDSDCVNTPLPGTQDREQVRGRLRTSKATETTRKWPRSGVNCAETKPRNDEPQAVNCHSTKRFPNAAGCRRWSFLFSRARLFPLHAGNGEQEETGERKMAKLISITAATALVIAAIFPAAYTFIAFA